jgi:hypothetical protein
LTPDPYIDPEAILAGEEALHPHDAETERSIRRQMDTLYQWDRWMAFILVALLLIALPFVYAALWDDMPGTGTKVALAVSGLMLLVYNVGAMVALVRNYRRDKDFIYRRDVAHLREIKVARAHAKAH